MYYGYTLSHLRYMPLLFDMAMKSLRLRGAHPHRGHSCSSPSTLLPAPDPRRTSHVSLFASATDTKCAAQSIQMYRLIASATVLT